MISKKEFYILCNKNSPKNKNRHNGPLDARLFLRDLSVHVAYFFAQRNISANTATILFLAVSVLGNFLIAIPSLLTLVIAILLYEVGQMLDCVDGQLARFYGIRSAYGEKLDNFSHILIHATSTIGIGWRLYATSTNPIFLILGAVGAVAFAVDNNHHHGAEPTSANAAERKSKLTDPGWYKKQVVFLIEEIRVFAVFLLICYLIQMYFLPIPLVELVYAFACLYVFVDNVVLGFISSVKKAAIVEKTTWKGWE